MNHSCDPNMEYVGLNLYARRAIARGEELTLDYGTFCGEDMEPFPCRCGSAVCRGLIRGSAAAARRYGQRPPLL
jgi:D-alanine-D-alanine ligase